MTEQVTVTVAPETAVHEAVTAALRFAASPLPDSERCRALRAVAAELRARPHDLAASMVDEIRKPVTLARLEVERSAEVLECTAAEWETLRGEVVPTHASEHSAGRLVYVKRQPVGVVCAITPFNFPVALTVHKLAPALAAGNACIVKPSEYAPQTVERLCSLFVDCGFPEDSIAVVPGGPEVVDALLAHPSISLYSFTGSARVGAKVKAASGLRPVVLELGANAATIVHHDADLARAAAAVARGAFAFSGQACFSVQRVIVHRDARAELVRLLEEEMARLPVGDPSDPTVLVGPLVNEAAAIRVESLIDDAVRAGATVLAGGRRQGDVVWPTLVTGVPQDSALWSEEAFGPVGVLAEYSTLDEAIRLANDSRYGLQTGIYTADLAVAMDASDRLQAGAVMINETSSWRATSMPFGGIRDSGFGREGPRYAIEAMTFQKTIGLAG